MNYLVAHCITTFVVILTFSAIVSVKGQCTIEGSEHGDQSTSTVTEMQQQSAQVLSLLNKQVHVMRGVLETSFQQLTAVRRILDVRSQDYDTDIKHQLWNAGDVRNGKQNILSSKW